MPTCRTACISLALLALLAGCDNRWNQAHDTPLASTLPDVPRPVGPVPGPGDAVAQPGNPYQGDLQAAWAGRALFVRMNCSGCHGGRAGGGMGPTLRDPTWIYGSKPADIFDTIAQGRAHGMPAWGTRLTQQQIWQLVTYIQSLNGPREPEAPQ